ncbi:MAG: hypothetical protein IT178_15360 [Acidobacteria bacterium]|nr:hypothetical protein [Acidobacteriota bacterium]
MTPAPRDEDADDGPLFDVAQIRAGIRSVFSALGDHWFVAILTFVVVTGGVAAAARAWPKTYQVDGRLLVHRNELMASLVNPGRTIPREAESPTRAAQEIVLSRQNLLTIMEATNLRSEWERTRPPLLRFKDTVMGLLQSPPSEEDRIDALIGLLEARLQVGTSEEGTVSFVLRWSDPQMAYHLVDEAMKSFLEYRKQSETIAITDSIAILDQSVTSLEAQINDTIGQLPRRKAPGRPTPAPRIVVPTGGPPARSVVQLSRLKAAIETKQQEVARLDSTRAQQLADAQGKLSAAQTVYTTGHPTVLALRQTVAQLSRDTPELAAARRELRDLETQHDALSVDVGNETARFEQARARAAAAEAMPPAVDPLSFVNVGDENEPVSLRLRVEMEQLAALRERLSAARAELSSAQAGFKYQYSVVRPPRVPRRPDGPNVPAIMLAGLAAGTLLAIAVPVLLRTLRS